MIRFNSRLFLLGIVALYIANAGISAEGEAKESVMNVEPEPNSRTDRATEASPEKVHQPGASEQEGQDGSKPQVRAKRYGYGSYGMGGGYGGYGMSYGGYGDYGGGTSYGGYGGGMPYARKTIIIKKIIMPGGGMPYYG